MSRRFDISHGRISLFLSGLLGLAPVSSGVIVEDDAVRVRMGWAFSVEIPRASIARVTPGRAGWYGVGVHGWGGAWVVNGRLDILWIDIDPPARARAIGFPSKLRRLGVSLEDPEGFIRQLGLDSAA